MKPEEQVIKVSIIITVYKIKKAYLIQCFNSCVNQTLSDIQIVVIIDGHDEETEEICKEYSDKYSHFSYIVQDNTGVSGARNRGISVAKGKYICFVDADDWIEDNYCTDLYTSAEVYAADMAICGYNAVYQNGMNSFPIKVPEATYCDISAKFISTHFFGVGNDCIGANLNSPWGKIYKREKLLEDNLLFDIKLTYGEDALFNFRFLTMIKGIVFLNQIAYNYRMRNSGIMRRKIGKVIGDNHLYLEQLKTYIAKTDAWKLNDDFYIFQLHTLENIINERIGEMSFVEFAAIIKDGKESEAIDSDRVSKREKLLFKSKIHLPVYFYLKIRSRMRKKTNFLLFD